MGTRATTVVDLIREDALDADLAALLWLLVEGRVPVVVCGLATEQRRREIMGALLALPPGTGGPPADPAVVGQAGALPAAVAAHLLALRPGDRFALIVAAESLRDVLARLTSEATGLSDDEIRALGLVVVVGADGRIDAAHLLRPVERDSQGHLQRRPPAVLASRDPSSGKLDHFAWGIAPEVADRVDLSERDLDRRWTGRARLLTALVAQPPADELAWADERRRLLEHLALEPPREPAPQRPPWRDPWPSGDEPHVH